MAKLGDLVVRIGADTRGLNKSLGKVQRNMRSMTANITKLGMSMSKAITLPIALIGAASIKMAVDFESSMSKVKAVSGATGEDFKSLEETAKKLGRTTVFTASEVAGLMLEYAKLGFTSDQINDTTEATLNLAQATGSDLAQAAEVAGATLGGFGLAASETQRVTDVMAAAFSSSALDIENFQESMKHVAPNAKAAGVSIEEASAMLAVLSKAGIKGGIAGTALRRILQEMQGTSGTLTERFAELSAQGIGLTGAMDEVGRRAGTSLLVLAEGSGQVQELTDSYKDSKGAAQAMADVMNDNAMGAIKRMTSALEGMGIAIGEMLSPMFEALVNTITSLSSWFTNLSSGWKKTVIIAAAFLAALGPMLIILPKIVVFFGLFKAAVLGVNIAMLANPFVAAAVAIAAITAAVVGYNLASAVAIKKTRNFRKELKLLSLEDQQKTLKEDIKTILPILEGLQAEVLAKQKKWDEKLNKWKSRADKERARTALEGAKSVLEQFTKENNMYLEELDRVNSEIKKRDSEADAAADAAQKKLDNKLTKVEKKLLELSRLGTTAMITLSNGVQEFAVNSSASLLAFLDDFTNVAEDIEDVNEGVKNSFTTLADTINAELERGVEAMIGGLALMAGAAVGAEKPIENMGAFMGETLAQMAINIGEYAIAHGTVIEAIKESLINLQGIPAIIAGAALIALGAGMQSAIKSRAESAGVPALAEGGLAYGPTLAMVGDNKGATVDPEVIAPLSKLKDMLGGNSIQVYGRISGDDIVISNNRASRDRNRF